MKMKRYVLVVPVWGERHFKNWLKYSLPSYLASNNIVYLLNHAHFSILICTDSITETIISNTPEIIALKQLCKVDVLNIQHIINTYTEIQYGYILTHCYHSAIKKYRFRSKQNHFIFLNADFILANGVFKTIHHLVNQGSEMIFCPSFRVIKEDFFAQLDHLLKNTSNKEISIEPRDMVSLALKHIHPTINAQTINNDDGVRSNITNQFFFKLEKNILLANHFIIFPLLVKPNKIPSYPTGYIDYNVAYDFHPRGNFAYITDSDDAFIVEPENREKESEYFILNNNIDSHYYSKMLSKWVNKTHYQNANQRLVFHSEQINLQNNFLQNKVAQFDQFMIDIMQNLKQSGALAPYRHHSYWGNKLLFVFLRRNVSAILRKLIERVIEFSSQIRFNTSYFLISDIKSTRFKLYNGFLKLNKLNLENFTEATQCSVYIDIEHYTSSQLMDIHFSNNKMKIYLYAFDYRQDIYNDFITNRATSVCPVKNINQHKAFLTSIMTINSNKDSVSGKIKSFIKILLIKFYLKRHGRLIVLEYIPDNIG